MRTPCRQSIRNKILLTLIVSMIAAGCGGGGGGGTASTPGPVFTPKIIINLSAEALNPGEVALEWSPAGSYRIYWVYMNDCLYTQVTEFEQGFSIREYASRLDPETRYCFRVVAYTFSPYLYVGESQEVCLTTPADVTPPESPAYVGAVSDPSPKISLAWTEAVDDAWVEKYRLYRNGSLLDETTDLTFIDTTADANTLYRYQVAAVDKAGNESFKSYMIWASAAWSSIMEDVGAQLGTSADTGNTSIALDSSGNPHVMYFMDRSLMYATKTTGDWIKTGIDGGAYPAGGASIAVGAAGDAHISFGSTGVTDLKYATNSTGNWVISTVDQWWVGTHSSIAVDPSGKAHISYYDYHNGNLKFATNASGSWTTAVVDNSYYVGQFTSIAVDSAGHAHISYYDVQNKTLKYATNRDGSWTTAVVDSEGMVGMYTSIAVDASGKAHISYCDETNRTLTYATNETGAWHKTAVHANTPSGTGWMTSLSLDTSGKVHISYNDWGYDALRYATNASGAWKTYMIGPAGSGASALRVDSFGNVHVSSHQTTKIVYSTYDFNL